MILAGKEKNKCLAPLVAAAITLFVVIAVIAFTAFKQPPTAQPMPQSSLSAASTVASPSPKTVYSTQKYGSGKTVLSSTRETTASKAGEGESSDEETLVNEGGQAARLGVAEVFSAASARDVEATALKNGKPLEARHVSLNPLVKYSKAELLPGEIVFFQARSRGVDFSENAPVRLFTAADLGAIQRARLSRVLSKIAELALELPQARALEKIARDAFQQVTAQENPFEAYVDALEEFIDDFHDETVAARRATPTPRPTPRIEEITFPIPLPPTPPTREEVAAVLPKVPEKITLVVSENNPVDSKILYLEAKTYLGEMVIKKEGSASNYVKATVERIGANYLLSVTADVEKAMRNERIPFNSLEGFVTVSFSALSAEAKRMKIVIKVEHVQRQESEVNEDLESSTESRVESGAESESPEVEPNQPVPRNDCLRDATALAETAKKYVPGGLPAECEEIRGRACACFVSAVMKEAGIVGVGIEKGAKTLYDKLLKSGKGVLITGATLTPSSENLLPGDLVFSKTYPGGHYAISHVEIVYDQNTLINGASGAKTIPFSKRSGVYKCGDDYWRSKNGKKCVKEGGTCCEDDPHTFDGTFVFQGVVRIVPSCIGVQSVSTSAS
ncbi:MAG: hypothetical protein QW343_02655 [Candidatus Norongarragalinales archaeon]